MQNYKFFIELVSKGDIENAVWLAISCSDLHSLPVIAVLSQLTLPNGVNAQLQYYHDRLEFGKLNEMETLNLCRILMDSNRIHIIERYALQNKLEMSPDVIEILVLGQAIPVGCYKWSISLLPSRRKLNDKNKLKM